MKVYIKYFTEDVIPVEKISKGDWIDLRAAADVEFRAGEFKLIPLGVGMRPLNTFGRRAAAASAPQERHNEKTPLFK